ncbi:MAG: FAD/NAD(P)-binding protein [Sphingomonadales bacterium]|nr:FAD/NAD(P)-binding protein [Sphingomonadales bacterium]MDE2170267.1 FAD/NAD(P)-binding protein [Sphingomonadales bacterium]
MPSSCPVPLQLAIIGTGPTALYTLKALIEQAPPCRIVLFEESGTAGPGIPFSPAYNSPAALANIAGVELPPLTETLNQWARRQPEHRLERWGIGQDAGDERAFFPRLALGAYFVDQLQQMLAHPRGHAIILREATRITDVIARADGVVLRWQASGKGETMEHEARDGEERFDRLVIATGYRAPRGRRGAPLGGRLGVELRRGGHVGVLGSSLSGIDVAVDLARRHGRFAGAGGSLRYVGDVDWHVTLLSRSGLLPEADFWFPHPAEPLDLFTDAALALLARGRDGDLDRVFALFARQLRALDPAYAEAIDLAAATADTFAEHHFARRTACDPFVWAARDLADARRSHRRREAEPWRYAILRMHEPLGRIVPRLTPRDLARFERGLKRCFIDNYAAVPHLSIHRLLAMHEAGVLSVARLGDRYTLQRDGEPWHIHAEGFDRHFDNILDARGQQALGLFDFPFPTLRLQLCAHALASGRDVEEGLSPDSGFVVDREDPALSRIHCLALPFLLKRNPFLQGLVESDAMGKAAVTAMLGAMAAPGPCPLDRADVEEMIARLSSESQIYCGSSGVVTIPNRQQGAALTPPHRAAAQTGEWP